MTLDLPNPNITRLDNLQQRSTEWHKAREGKRTASELSAVMGLSPFVTPAKLKLIKAGIMRQYFNSAMQQGVELEAQIRQWAENHFQCVFSDPVFVHGDYLASLDGYNEEQGLLVELKCSTKTYSDIKAGEVPAYYRWQILQQLYCSGAKQAFLVAYCPKADDYAVSDVIFPLESFKQDADAAWEKFEAMPLPEGDVDASDNLVLKSKFDMYAQKKAQVDALQEELEAIKAELLEFKVDKRNVSCQGYSIQYRSGAKRVDYKAACKGVDLEPFTKVGEPTWSIVVAKSPFEAEQ